MSHTEKFDWRTIGALNTVSTLSQIGQYGIAFVMIPVWLADQGLDAGQLGIFAASLWLGQLPGLAVAPWLCNRLGHRLVVASGLWCTVAALPWIAMTGWPWSPLGGALAGFGLGLRWIGVEPWLYRIAPSHARGRLVGFHESLIALAPVVGPLVTGQFALKGSAVFWIGSAFTALALLPLALARSPSRAETQTPAEARGMNLRAPLRERVFRVGIAVALVGGAIDAAVTGLFALFAQDRGLVVDQVANLLAIYGVGGLLIQYPVGWLCDHRGVGTSALWCAIGTLITALVLSVPLPYALFVGAMFLLGGFINAFLTLALIASAMTRGGNMETNVSLISMLFTGAAALGPLTAGGLMKSTQPASLMWFAATAALIMVAALIAIVVPRSSPGVSEAAAGLGERI